MLELPPTLSIPTLDEIPNNIDVIERLKARENANIVEGFVIHVNNNQDLFFEFFAEINVNNSRFWDLFVNLAACLPNPVRFIYGLFDDEPTLGNLQDKEIVMKFIEAYKKELTQDCDLELGLIHHSESILMEVFAKSDKYIQYWGTNDNQFRQVMYNFQLNEVSDLKFVDEFPKTIVPLTTIDCSARQTEEIINEFDIFFQQI